MSGPVKLGLTGSIGMGKSTTAGFFREMDVPVWDADEAVARLYAKGGKGVGAIKALAPAAIKDGAVERHVLRNAIIADSGLLKKIEAVIHPLVGEDRSLFNATHQNEDLIVFDIPLLFETGADAWLDIILVVTADPETQRQRVLERPGMTDESFAAILSKQLPDEEKRARADYVIDTGLGLDPARKAVYALVDELKGADLA